MGFLSPSFLADNIDLIGQIMSVMILVVFDEFVTGRVIFPSVDKLKNLIFEKSKVKFKKPWIIIPKYFSEFLATALFISYFFAGYWVLSEYAIVPILTRLQNVILLIVLAFFLTMSYLLNNRKTRKKYFDYN